MQKIEVLLDIDKIKVVLWFDIIEKVSYSVKKRNTVIKIIVKLF